MDQQHTFGGYTRLNAVRTPEGPLSYLNLLFSYFPQRGCWLQGIPGMQQ